MPAAPAPMPRTSAPCAEGVSPLFKGASPCLEAFARVTLGRMSPCFRADARWHSAQCYLASDRISLTRRLPKTARRLPRMGKRLPHTASGHGGGRTMLGGEGMKPDEPARSLCLAPPIHEGHAAGHTPGSRLRGKTAQNPCALTSRLCKSSQTE